MTGEPDPIAILQRLLRDGCISPAEMELLTREMERDDEDY